MHPLAGRVTDALAFGDDDTDEGVVVSGFDVSFFRPCREAYACGVFALDNNSLAMDAEASDVAAVFGTSFRPAVNPVIVEDGG